LTGLTVRKGNSWNAQKDNFGPQIGVAWSPSRFRDKLVVRAGYGLNYNQEEIAISANIQGNPGLVVFPSLNMATPTSPNPGIIYAVSSGVHDLNGFPANPNTVSSFGPNGLPTTGSVNVSIFPNDLPTMRVHHYSVDAEYDLGHDFVASLGYQGSLSRNTYFHENPLAVPTLGYPFNADRRRGLLGFQAAAPLLARRVKRRFSQRQFMADARRLGPSMDTSSAPYSEQIHRIATA
jgi:hypothetical protein